MNDSKSLISVVIPAFNAQNTVPDLVGDFLAQTYGNIEIICVDDGSDDDTLKCIRELAESHENVRAVSIPHGGPTAARSAGADAAAGEWIIFADADDRVAPDWLEALITGAHEIDPQGEADIIVGASCWKRSAEENEPQADHRGLFHSGDEMNAVWDRLFYHSDDKTALISGSMCDKLFRIGLARRAFCGIDRSVRIGEDSCFTTVAFAYARAAALTYAQGYRWTSTRGSLSFSPIGCVLQDYKSVYSHARRALDEQGYGEYAGKLWYQFIGYIVANRLYITLAGGDGWESLAKRFMRSFKEAADKH